MSGLIPIDEITELKSASEVSAVADDATAIIEEQTMAAAINKAANTGEHFITWSKPISEELEQKLEDMGYRVVKNVRAANPEFSWTISF